VPGKTDLLPREHLMKDATERFSGRVGAYVKYRQGYPDTLIPLIEEKSHLTRHSVVADVGCGTGLLAECFLRNGYPVFGVEPNQEMRESAEQRLHEFAGFRSVAGSAESTGLKTNSIDLVTVGRAFHWFKTMRALAEFSRILKAEGSCAIVWNQRKGSPFMRDYDSLLHAYCDDYREIRSARDDQRKLLEDLGFCLSTLAHREMSTMKQLQGKILSLSITPDPQHPRFEPMLRSIEELFHKHEGGGQVCFEYDTLVYHKCHLAELNLDICQERD
jgi:ubiquinone/menaquinone biosynthesis C-methylase UbiE